MRRAGRPGLIGLTARTAVVAGTAATVTGAVGRGRARREQEEQAQLDAAAQAEQARIDRAVAAAVPQRVAPQEPAAPTVDASGLVAEIQRLGALRDQGLLSEDEFSAAKRKLLG
ncbi:SHOCT domain-containing protein [Amnibacterium kyonggiense]|nr:SHOCT domain-containing protein [Amnibacterium kyonggiense]